MAKIIIPYKKRKYADILHGTQKRWNVLVWHRRAGKTVACINHLIREAMMVKDARYAYIAPTYRQAKDVAWDYLKHFSRPIPGIVISETDLSIYYPTGSRIRLYGADNPDSLRGIALWGVVFDEYAQQPSNIFTEIIRPALSDHRGWAIWISTPKGVNEFKRLFDYGKAHPENWNVSLLTVADTDVIHPEEVEDLKKEMSEDEFAQEYLCSFNASIQGSYWAKEIAELISAGRYADFELSREPGEMGKMLPVHTAWDLGVGDSTAIWFFQLPPEGGVKVIDCLESEGVGMEWYFNELKKRPYIYGDHFAPHDIMVTEFGTGLSRYEQAKKMGVHFKVVKSLKLDDGIQGVRKSLSKVWFHKKCELGLQALQNYHKEWDPKRGVYQDRPKHDWTSHYADAFRYLCISVENTLAGGGNYSVKKPRQQTDLDELFEKKDKATYALFK